MIALVDGNNFYVSCERIFAPELCHRPVAVLSNNDGCVISRSNEFKALNIPMGTPFFQLKEKMYAQHLILKSSNYELYGDISRRVIAVLHDFSPDVEQYSIDEAFVHFQQKYRVTDYQKLGQTMRETLLRWVGIPCGVGFAPTKTLAKIANHIGKKLASGVFIMPRNPERVLARTPVSEVWGIGNRLAPKLQNLGINTAWQLAQADEILMRKKFSVTLAETILELRGQPMIPPENSEELSQSISCSRSFGEPVTEFSQLREAVSFFTAQAATKLRQEQQVASGANVSFVYFPEYQPGFVPGGISDLTVNFGQPTANTSELQSQINPQLRRIFIPGLRYKKAGVLFWGLESTATQQLDLFNHPDERGQQLSQVRDAINRQFGRHTLFTLSEGINRPWQMKRERLSPRYTTSWDELPEVR